MTKVSRFRRSRDSWKGKATVRSEQLIEFRRTKAGQQRKLAHLQAGINTLEDKLGKIRER